MFENEHGFLTMFPISRCSSHNICLSFLFIRDSQALEVGATTQIPRTGAPAQENRGGQRIGEVSRALLGNQLLVH
jgi:hypothetical protein